MTDWVAGAVLAAALNGLVQGLMLTVLVWIALRLLPRGNAATRYAVWWATLLAVASLPVLVAPAGNPVAPGARAVSGGPILSLPPGRWQVLVFAAWGMITMAMLARLAWSYISILQLKRRARPLPLAQAAGLGRAWNARNARILVSDQIAVPMAAGLHNPVVLLPESLIRELSGDDVAKVLLHELAHLRRRDDWTNLFQKVVEAVLFFHPAVRWIGRRLNLEREIACDDWVVSATGQARPYAACLTRLIERTLPARSPQLAHGAAGRKRQISRRIEALLSRRRNSTAALSRSGALAGAAVLAIAAMLAGRIEPIAVAEPPLEVLAVPQVAAPAATLAYTAPPSVSQPERPRIRTVAARSARHEPRYVLIEEWTVPVAPAFYVFSIRGAGQVVTIFWRRPVPVQVVINRT